MGGQKSPGKLLILTQLLARSVELRTLYLSLVCVCSSSGSCLPSLLFLSPPLPFLPLLLESPTALPHFTTAHPPLLAHHYSPPLLPHHSSTTSAPPPWLLLHCSPTTAPLPLFLRHCSPTIAPPPLLPRNCSLSTALPPLLSHHCFPTTALPPLLLYHCSLSVCEPRHACHLLILGTGYGERIWI